MTGIIILAAGSSSRLGKPKQNLIFKGQTLLQNAIETAKATICKPVIVVLGANADVIEPTIKDLNIHIVHNANWTEGMASSIREGIKTLQKIEPDVDAVILMLCDQPLVDTYILNLLILAQAKPGIVACSYNETSGPPALFATRYFQELLLSTGHEGAKKLLIKYAEQITTLPFKEGSVDIDTVGDYESLHP